MITSSDYSEKEFQAIADQNTDKYDVQIVDSRNTASIQNDQIDSIISKGVKCFCYKPS